MIRETSDNLDSKISHHSDSSANLSISFKEMQDHFSNHKKESSSSAQSSQFLDMGDADSLYGKGAHNSVHKMADQQFDIGKAVQDWAGNVADAGKHAIESVIGKPAVHVQDSPTPPGHVEIPVEHRVDKEAAFRKFWYPEIKEDGKQHTMSIKDLDKFIANAKPGEDYFIDIPKPDIDPGFQIAEPKGKRDIDPGFEMKGIPKGRQVLTERQMDKLMPIEDRN